MTEADEVLGVVQAWVSKAENDLKNAMHTLEMGRDCPTDTVCFHAQQCTEKYMKALLISKTVDFPRTHDVSFLLGILSPHCSLELTPEEQRRLTDYATVLRYPGDYEEIPLEEAQQAVKLARRVRASIRKLLPRRTLQR